MSPLKDDERALKLLHLVHGWLSKDLQLPLPSAWRSKKGRIYTFGAFLGVPFRGSVGWELVWSAGSLSML